MTATPATPTTIKLKKIRRTLREGDIVSIGGPVTIEVLPRTKPMGARLLLVCTMDEGVTFTRLDEPRGVVQDIG